MTSWLLAFFLALTVDSSGSSLRKVVALVTAGFLSRRGKDVTAVTIAKVEKTDLASKVTANGCIDAADVREVASLA